MTCQVIVGNMRAIAIASDSSVTLSNGGGSRRTFANAEKVFPLPAPHLVAILHSGNVKVMGVPIDVILAEWIMDLGDDVLPTLGAYNEHFTTWLGRQQGVLGPEQQTNHYLDTVREYMLDLRRVALNRIDGIGDEETRLQTVEKCITEDRDYYVHGRAPFNGLDENWAIKHVNDHLVALEELLIWAFDDVPLTDGAAQAAWDIAYDFAFRSSPFSSLASLAFAGYGADEVFPSWLLMDLDGVVFGRARVLVQQSTHITPECDAVLSPLGQSEAMHTFLRGYDASFHSVATERLEGFAKQIAIVGGTEEGAMHDKEVEEAKSALVDDFRRESSERFVDPMIRTVAAMPAADLARVAESLVGLQVLRQLTQAEMETVGGPIDVALITRSGGFRWLRGKHVVAAEH